MVIFEILAKTRLDAFSYSYVTLITLNIVLNALFRTQSRDIVYSIFATMTDQQENTNSTNCPPCKLKYAKHTYDMLDS